LAHDLKSSKKTLSKYKESLVQLETKLLQTQADHDDHIKTLKQDYLNKLKTQHNLNASLKQELQQTQVRLGAKENEIAKLSKSLEEHESNEEEQREELNRIATRMSGMEDLVIKYNHLQKSH